MLNLIPILLQGSILTQGSAPVNVTVLNATIHNATAAAATVNPGNVDAGLMVFVEETLTVVTLLLMVLAVSLQLARGYFLRILRKFTLRLTADLWWLIYVILRDLTVFLAFFLGLVDFFPSANLIYPIAVPFMPAAIVLYAFALVLIMTKDTDESAKYDTMVTQLLGLGTALYMIGTIGVTESALSLAILPSTVSLSPHNPWQIFNTYFNSVNNPALEMYTFYVGFVLLAIAGILALKWSLTPSAGMPKKEVTTVAKPVFKPPAAPVAAQATATVAPKAAAAAPQQQPSAAQPAAAPKKPQEAPKPAEPANKPVTPKPRHPAGTDTPRPPPPKVAPANQ